MWRPTYSSRAYPSMSSSAWLTQMTRPSRVHPMQADGRVVDKSHGPASRRASSASASRRSVTSRRIDRCLPRRDRGRRDELHRTGAAPRERQLSSSPRLSPARRNSDHAAAKSNRGDRSRPRSFRGAPRAMRRRARRRGVCVDVVAFVVGDQNRVEGAVEYGSELDWRRGVAPGPAKPSDSLRLESALRCRTPDVHGYVGGSSSHSRPLRSSSISTWTSPGSSSRTGPARACSRRRARAPSRRRGAGRCGPPSGPDSAAVVSRGKS